VEKYGNPLIALLCILELNTTGSHMLLMILVE